MKVLIVDDSVVFRSQIKAIVEELPQIDEIGLASNGKLALQKLETTQFDLMTLDLEMPEMNGLELLRLIRDRPNRPAVIVFSSLTTKGAEQTIAAMDLGADGVTNKPRLVQNLDEARDMIRQDLLPKIISISSRLRAKGHMPSQVPLEPPKPMIAGMPILFPPSNNWREGSLDVFRPKAVVIGSSTGGPSALKTVLERVRAPISVPILITQHMPPSFTKSLATSLGLLTGMEADEAKHLEIIKPNKIYVAPGDYHMTVKNWGDEIVVALDQSEKRNSVRPSVDPLFESAAAVFGQHLLGIILTGMGQDGTFGCKAIKDKRGVVIIQDEASSAVWGMPGSVHRHGAFDKMLPLNQIDLLLQKHLQKTA